MAVPDNVSTVWIRGRFVNDNGSPMQGTVTFTRTAKVLLDRDRDLILVSRVASADLDASGQVLCELIASDDPDVIPTGFTYTVHDPTPRADYPMLVPAATPIVTDVSDPLLGLRVIELSDVIPASGPNAGTVQIIAGPTGLTGPEGPTGPPGPLYSGSLSPPALLSGVYTVTVTSNWGVDSGGLPYYDPAGAVAGDAAIASLDSSGALVLTKPGG